MSAWRRYEILLPLRFNDRQSVPDAAIGDTLLELENQFGAVAWEMQIIHGRWHNEGQVKKENYEDAILETRSILFPVVRGWVQATNARLGFKRDSFAQTSNSPAST